MSHLPSIITTDLLTQIRTHPTLRPRTWDIISAVTLSALNRPDEITKIYTASLSSIADGPNAHSERLQISRRMREALLKASAVGGVPKTINALLHLKEGTPEDLLDSPTPSPSSSPISSTPSPTSRYSDIYTSPSASILTRGQVFFDALYGRISKRVMGQMDRCGTEDLGLIARLVYGHILSNERILSAAETSFCLIAGLIPQDVNPQLKGHLRGALNGGASVDEVRAVREVVILICEAVGMKRIENDAPGGWGWREEVANL